MSKLNVERLQLDSKQESLLEFLMSNSFGSRFLFVPEKYMKGNATRHPADLAWVDDDLIVLFYMTSSAEKDPIKQTEHNIAQAKGYKRVWVSNNLKGKNRFDDKCNVPYASVKKLITIEIHDQDLRFSLRKPFGAEIRTHGRLAPSPVFKTLDIESAQQSRAKYNN